MRPARDCCPLYAPRKKERGRVRITVMTEDTTEAGCSLRTTDAPSERLHVLSGMSGVSQTEVLYLPKHRVSLSAPAHGEGIKWVNACRKFSLGTPRKHPRHIGLGSCCSLGTAVSLSPQTVSEHTHSLAQGHLQMATSQSLSPLDLPAPRL